MSSPEVPANITRIFVAGYFTDSNDVATAGKLVVTPDFTRGINDAWRRIVMAAPTSMEPSASTGLAYVSVVAGDDPDLNPSNFTHTVSEPGGRKYQIFVAQDTPVWTAGTPGHPLEGQRVLWLNSVAPSDAPSSGVVQVVAGPQGPPGDVSAAQLSAAVAAAKLADRPDLDTTGAAVGQVPAVATVDGSGNVTGWRVKTVPPAVDSFIDLCSAYNVAPGDDITAALQSAINALAASGQSGTIFISKVGTYTLNGPLQTGTYTGGTGAGDLSGGGQVHTWNGQVIIPAVPFRNAKAPAIAIEGAVDPSGGWSSTGDAQGVTIASTITSGHMIDTASGYDGWGFTWTGIMPIFRNLIFRLPDNPTAGAINITHALRTRIERVAVLTQNSWVYPGAGDVHTAVGIGLPQMYENGDMSIRDVNVRGYPTAFRFSEHGVFDNIQIVGCRVAFLGRNGGHRNWFGYVTVEEVETIILAESGGTNAIAVYGFLDTEGNTDWPYMKLYEREANSAIIIGVLDPTIGIAGSFGLKENGSTSAAYLDVRNPNHRQNSGWTAIHPRDTFVRMAGRGLPSSAGAPGYTWPTFHPWRVQSGSFDVAASGGAASGSMHSSIGNAGARCLLPVLDARIGGRPRSVMGTFAKGGTSHSFHLIAQRRYDANQCVYVSLKNSTLYLGVGAFTSGAGKVSAAVTPGATTQLRLDLHYVNGAPKVAQAWMDGVLVLSYVLTSADQALIAPSTTLPYLEDGLGFSDTDTTSTVTDFVVRDIQTPLAGLRTGTATLVAGTVTVADTNVTSASIIRLHRQAAGGTPGQLSVALAAGTGFTINSSSGTDTSTVYYEIVSY